MARNSRRKFLYCGRLVGHRKNGKQKTEIRRQEKECRRQDVIGQLPRQPRVGSQCQKPAGLSCRCFCFRRKHGGRGKRDMLHARRHTSYEIKPLKLVPSIKFVVQIPRLRPPAADCARDDKKEPAADCARDDKKRACGGLRSG